MIYFIVFSYVIMVDFKKMVDDFHVMKLDDKKKHLINMFNAIEKKEDIHLEMIKAIQNGVWIDDEFCNEAYYIMIELLQAVDDITRKWALDKLTQAHNKILALQAQEAKEREQENPDALLDLI